ncbi:hypothetical protein GCM10010911_12490 [Paenibacillus nasutitermitis]|uniref:Uncharacterized protein n=1 Tax=Paenibacillus nasutitermitis TaxID=1652958 RepID=A0A916YQZ3_9BACL|nr:hypothetical protein GCM10010911_12490 [Paenibacillus nasutitermitis]
MFTVFVKGWLDKKLVRPAFSILSLTLGTSVFDRNPFLMLFSYFIVDKPYVYLNCIKRRVSQCLSESRKFEFVYFTDY